MAAPDPGFLRRVEELIADLTARLDTCDPDQLEAEVAGGVLKISFAGGTQCVLNRQSAVEQIWLAEGANAWHFAWDEASRQWLDTKGRGELLAILGDILRRRLGRQVDLTP